MAAAPETSPAGIVLTLALERADGIERMVFRCAIAKSLAESDMTPEALAGRIAPWVEREFEQTREAALKSIRAERRLLEIIFDREHPGPF
jgi:hypothetical protein